MRTVPGQLSRRNFCAEGAIAKVGSSIKLTDVNWAFSKPFEILLLLFVLVLVSVCPITFSQPFGTFSGIKINYGKGPMLSGQEVDIAIKLARRAGMTNIAEIYSYYLHPSPQVGIGVKGHETITGRRLSFVSIQIETEGLAEEIIRRPTEILVSEDNYWIGAIRTNTFTLFEAKGRTIRVSLSDKVSVEQADSLIAALATKEVRYGNGEAFQASRHVDFSSPLRIYVGTSGKIRVGFSCGDWCSVSFECELREDGVHLSEPFQVVS